jgi:subtilisin family serine protease
VFQADIITASIGGISGWSTNAWAVIASRLVDNGVVVTIAAGNDGVNGPFFGSNGSLGPHVLAVASTDAGEIPADPFEMTFSLDGADNTSTFGYLPAEEPMTVKGLPITPMVLHAPDNEDACQPFTFKGRVPDLSKSIPLIRTGGCYNWEKQTNLRDLGAEYILFYNPDGPFNRISSYVTTPLVNIIEAAAAEAIMSTVKAGGKVTVDFSKQVDYKLGVYNSVGGLPSPFTSWGGTFDGSVKPDIAAPGGNIYSTFLDGTYMVLGGTSMATPYIAGVAALWVGKFGGRKQHGPEWARQLSNRIISSGAALRWHTETIEGQNPIDNGLWAPVHQVGAGQVDAWKVLDYATSLEFDNMALNDTHTFSRYHKVQIRNNGKETVTYKFALQPAAALNIKSFWREGYLTDLTEPLDPYTFVPEVSFPSGTFKVAPGQVKTAQ